MHNTSGFSLSGVMQIELLKGGQIIYTSDLNQPKAKISVIEFFFKFYQFKYYMF